MPSMYHTSLQEYLSPEQIVLLEMLVRVIQIFKQIKIEKLAARIPLPIKFESRRRAIQRFLWERALDISLRWLPIIKQIVDRKMSEQKHRAKKKNGVERTKIYLAMDRTQWQEHNILMVAIIIDKRALPIYWKRKYRGKQLKEAWHLVTNLNSADAAIAAYSRRMGIEMMFRDCKLGGYHLEGSKASTPRLNRLVLLIAIAYTGSSLQGNKYRSTSTSKYIGRDKKLRYDTSDTSRFWLGNYADDWLMMMDLMSNSV
jgi:hypothetical protein